MSLTLLFSVLLSSMFAGGLSGAVQDDFDEPFLAFLFGAVIGLFAGLASLGVLAILGVHQ